MTEVTTNPEPIRDYLLPNRVYDFLQYIVQIVLPAAAALYLTLAQTWGLPKPEEIAATVAAINVFFGLLLRFSNRSYNRSEAKYDGSIDVEQREDDSKLFSLSLNSDPDEIEKMKEVTFKINPS